MNKKLHILFLCGWYPSEEFSTNGDFIERHAKSVSSIHKVSVLHIVSSDNNKITKDEISENLTVNIAYIKQTKNPIIKFLRFLNAYKKTANSANAIDIVHLNILFPFGFFALYQKLIYKTPFIISEHWTGYIKSIKASYLQKFISKIISRNAFKICPVSNQLKDGMQSFGLKGNYSVIGNVVDTQIFKPSNNYKISYTIVHVSSLNDHQKNITGMLNTAKKLESEISNLTWKFIGGKQDEYLSLIKQLDFKSTNIDFINHVSQEELVTQLQLADICISFSNYETFGIVMTEAIASGTYVISTDTGILNEIEPQNYFTIIKRNDVDGLKNAIIDYYSSKKIINPDEMYSYINNNFSIKQIALSFDSIYKQALLTKN